MKFIHSTLVRSTLAAVFIAVSAGAASAHYTHDNRGWYDENHHRHDYVTYHGHKGYWDRNDSGIWAFIRI
jgi:hypothetical protein